MSSRRFINRGASSGVQMSFDGLAPPVPTDRLFFALFPEPAAVDAVAVIQRDVINAQQLAGRPILPERLHVTLQHLGDFAGLPNGLIAASERAAAELRESAFSIGFDQLGSFASHRRQCPYVLTSSAEDTKLHSFQRSLAGALARQGVDLPGSARFKPHVTLLYDRQQHAMAPIEPVAWVAREFVLIHSLLGQTRHIVLGRWSLLD